ncbi:glycosyltransferase family 4 protein [Aquibacillus sp. 3ASR75-11]|uniref:Glycosyltransferase family 4 protein n=1 Tax=Terrihalobacillus insolitus TaxID=2950438 RepID=A0A9X4ANY4_9BACI|nr:glycosyltransferase family 4 protein [Terrihalobacillus insolitus]MDC3411818.1 glycosyltransferase family 4 protein [Terrihalobacillus insolitus]MDC3425003.1 glycosyltransferase family 4 protein [Terrihalobacillus insolitus]
MTKKVLIMTQNFYPVIGSAGNRMKNIFQLLNDQKGMEVHVLTTEPAYPNKSMYSNDDLWDDEAVNRETEKINRIPIKNKRFSNHIFSRLFFYVEIMYRFFLKLFELKKNKYDYILVSTPPIFIVLSAFIGRRLFGAKLILEVRDLWPDSLLGVKAFDHPFIIRIFRYLEKKMYRNADYIVINSKGFEDHIVSKLNKRKPIIYLPNGPRINELVKDKVKKEEFSVIYAGNLGLAQDVNRLKSIAILLNNHNIRFDVLGYGIKTNEFKTLLRENKLNNVHIHEPTTRKKSLNIIKNSDLGIAFLNDEEVFSTVLPGKILDYMTCQTPIVAGVKGTAADMITSNKTGFVFDSDSIDAMINKILELKNDKQQVDMLEENCYYTITNRFVWENNIDKLVEIIK